MLVNTKCTVKISGWNYKQFWKPESIVYIDGDGRDPRLCSGPGWFRSKDGTLVRVTSAEQIEYKGKQPFTTGFREAFAEVDIPLNRPKCRLGHAVVILEARNLSWQPPAEFGMKVRELPPCSSDPFPDRPFECYLLDEDSRKTFDERRTQALEKLVNRSLGIAPDAYLHVTVSLDSWVHYTRDIPFTPVNELSEVEAVMNAQLQSVIQTDFQRLDWYFKLGRFPVTFHELRKIFA